jgi:RNA polymerase sigma factor (sigma-70 family)
MTITITEKEKIFNELYPMINQMAMKYHESHKLCSFEDLRQEASLKVWNLLDSYNPKKSKPSTFIYTHLLDAFQDVLASTTPVNIGKTNIRLLGRINEELAKGKELSEIEIEGVTKKRILNLVSISYISFDTEINGGDNRETTLADIISDESIPCKRKVLIQALEKILTANELTCLLQKFEFEPKDKNFNPYYVQKAIKKIQALDEENKKALYQLLS